MISTLRHYVATRGQGDIHDLTDAVRGKLQDVGVDSALVTVFVVGATAAIAAMEFEPGAIADLHTLFSRLAPRDSTYQHQQTWGDDNGSSHARASLVGPSVSIPVEGGDLLLAEWQQIVLLEFDTQARTREIVIQIISD